MSTMKFNGKKPFRRRGRANWLRAATAAALVAGSATITMAASRHDLRTEASSAPSTASFRWQMFTPGRLVRVQPPNGANGPLGDLHTDALRAPAANFAWKTFSPGHVVNTDRPNGSGASGSGNTQTDALRAPLGTFHWETFAPGHIVKGEPSNGAGDAGAGGLHTDAIRSRAFRPTLVYGLGRDEAGGFRTEMALSFRFR